MAINAQIIDFLLAGYRDPTTDTQLNAGTVEVYAAGTLNTAYVWDSRDKTLPTTTGRSTVTLDAYGRAEVYGDNIYKFIIKDSAGSTVETIDYAEYVSVGGSSADDMLGLINTTATADGQSVEMLGFFASFPQSEFDGGGVFTWQSGLNKNLANGGSVIDPDNIGGFDGTTSTLSAFLAAQGAGTGSGCWVRVDDDHMNVLWFGATGDGSTDDTTALQAAIDAAPVGSSIFVPSGEYLCSGVTIEKPLRVYGESHTSVPRLSGSSYYGGSSLKALTGGENYVIQVKRGTGTADSVIRNWEDQLYGVTLEHLSFDGDDRNVDMGALYLNELDHSTFFNIEIQQFAREAINCYEEVRECDFVNLRTRWCGNKDTAGTSYPAINLTENGTVDSHNALRFTNCQIIFSLGDSVLYEDNASAANAVRQIFWNSCFFHGILASQDGGLYTFTADQKTTSHHNIKGAKEVFFNQIDLHQTGDGVPAINMEDSINGVSPQIWFNNGRIDSHYSSTTPQYGIDVNTGELSLSMTQLRNHISGVVRAESGATVHYGLGNVLDTGGTAPSYHASAIVTQNLYSDVYFNDHTLSKVGELDVRTVTSRNTSESILIESQIDNSASAINIRTKNGSDVVTSRVDIGAGLRPEAYFIGAQVRHATFTDANRGNASDFGAGTQIWNSDDNAPNYSDGTNWRLASGALT